MKTKIIINGVIYSHAFRRQQILDKVDEIANRIKKDYADAKRPPLLLFVRNGGLYFGIDLSRALAAIDFDPDIDTVGLRRYNPDNQGGKIDLLDWPHTDLSGRHVIVVEDLIDVGASMNFLYHKLQECPQKPESIVFCTLFLKNNHAPLDFEIKYLGWEIGPEWVVGNGMDSGQSQGRGLVDVYQA